MNVARLGNKYLADNEPWKLIKTDPQRVATILNLSLQIAAHMMVLSEPFMPFTAKKLAGMLNLEIPSWELATGQPLLAEGTLLNPAELLFEKIEDAQIEVQLEKLAATKRENEKKGYKAAPQKPEISFDDFSRMDIRTGTILEAVKVPKSTKLIQMKVDTGIDIRTIVSGIAEYFQPEELPGKQVSVLVNLAPRKIKNIESLGMILLAEDHDGKLVFVVPEAKIVNGGAVK